MKSLKITLVAIFSIFSIFSLVLLTGVNSSDDIVTVKEETNKEIKGVKIDLIALTDKKGIKPPTGG